MQRDLWFEDFAVGQRFATAGCTLSEAQILEFGWAHDPQPFHIDRDAAAAGPFGGLIASGFQTLLVPSGWSIRSGSSTPPRWARPASTSCAGRARCAQATRLRVAAEVVEIRPSRSKPDRGVVTIAYTVLNQAEETVMSFRAMHLLRATAGRRWKADPRGASVRRRHCSIAADAWC